MPSESRLSGIDRRILNDVWSPHMYARRAAPRLGPHVEMTPWRRGAPASRVRRYAYADALYRAATRYGRARGAHTRRDGARGAVRPVALSPVTAAMVHTHTSRAGRPYSARSFRWGRRPGGRGRGPRTRDGAGRARDGPSDVCDVSSQRRICDFHIAYGRYPGRSRWVCPGDMDIGAAIIAR